MSLGDRLGCIMEFLRVETTLSGGGVMVLERTPNGKLVLTGARSSGHDGHGRKVQESLACGHEEWEQLGNDKLISSRVVPMVS